MKCRQFLVSINLLSILAVLAVFTWGCTQKRYCDNLVELISDEKVRQTLQRWVDDNISDDLLNSMDLKLTGRSPGSYLVPLDFQWSILGFDNATVSTVTDPGKNIYSNTSSILFSERSRAGIIVKKLESEKFGIPIKSDLLKIHGRTAVVCQYDE